MIKNDVNVSTICGSCAFINALVASGLDTKHFYFYGFLPAKESEAKEEILSLKDRKETIIFYEAPHRINKTLNLLRDGLGNRNVCLARELTKLNEEYIRGSLDELVEIDESTIKGEIVLIVEGNKEENTVDDNKITTRVAYFVELGLSQKDAINVVSEEFNVNKNYVKKLVF
jgi:16S rRNA (cytidine1402-2'-O)-methyltransferase